LEIKKTYQDDVAVVEVSGKLVGGLENTQKFHDLIAALLGEGATRIVVNLRDTPWANSQGIGMLIGAYTSAKKASARLVLAEVGGRIRDVLEITRLSLIFEIFLTVDAAVEGTSGPHAGRSGPATRPTALLS
jgi:anti-sigma B factor antagonist